MRAVFLLAMMCTFTSPAGQVIDLAGTWKVRLDPEDAGVEQSWQQADFADTIHLPGSLAEHGYGDDPVFDSPWIADTRVLEKLKDDSRFKPYFSDDNLKMPCWLQPEKFYVGAAWYQKDVTIPPEWKDKRIILQLERAHWETRVWIDDTFNSADNALGVPHIHDLSDALTPGRHRITIRVDNRMIVNIGPNSHSVSDHTQSSWNGLVGELHLSAADPVWIDDIQVYPVAASRSANVDVMLGNRTGKSGSSTLNWEVTHKEERVAGGTTKVDWDAEGGTGTFDIQLGPDAKLWDEFAPNLYELSVSLENSQETQNVAFGLRDLGVDGTQFTINGRKLFLRGTLECAIFPLTGYPPTDVESWRRIIRICREHGLNHIRFHSWCPPEAAFEAADEVGFYLQVECSSWANQGATLGDGNPLDQWLYDEGHRMTKAYGNHPSFALMAYGNEPKGDNREEYLEKWCAYWKKENPRCLHTSGAGWPRIENSDFHNVPQPRIQRWGAGLESRVNALPPETVTDYAEIIQEEDKPIISHEIGQWCVYPNFEEMKKYTGVLKPRNFEIFQDLLARNNMTDQARDFLMASGKLQTLLYKEDIESSLRTPGFGGFQLLDLHDFPGQGTALVGILDPFWDSKPYVSPEEFRRFCGPTVPLARLKKRIWESSETFHADIEMFHFGAAPINDAQVYWKIINDSSEVMASGYHSERSIPVNNCIPMCKTEIDCRTLDAPAKYKLVVGLTGTDIENDWDFWVYPDSVETPESDILTVDELTSEALSRLKEGGKVLLMPDPERIESDVAIGFSSVFWNTLWTGNQPPHTLGILCDPKHPVFKDFPTEYHSNWQWWELIHGSSAMVLNEMPNGLSPLVQPVDDWFEARRLGLLFEAEVNGGKLMMCSMDLRSDLASRPVARQMRASILNYMAGGEFKPEVELTADQLTSLMSSEK